MKMDKSLKFRSKCINVLAHSHIGTLAYLHPKIWLLTPKHSYFAVSINPLPHPV